MNSPLLLYNASIVDPRKNKPFLGGVLIVNGKIAKVSPALRSPPDSLPPNTTPISCRNLHIFPGAVDLFAASGEPGEAYLEDFASLGEAAAAGGVTTLALIPDASPPVDDPAIAEALLRRARELCRVRALPLGALTHNLQGLRMTDMSLLMEAGAVGLCDGFSSIASPSVMRNCLSWAANINAPVIHHAEDPSLAANTDMHLGSVSTQLGLRGNPWASETIALERDIRLAELTNSPCHAPLLSAQQSLDAVRAAKKRGVPFTCSVSAAHLLLNDTHVPPWRTFAKLSPPLRSPQDQSALINALSDGTLDAVVSAHRPRDPETKRLTFAEASFGAAGVETLLPSLLSLHHSHQLSLNHIARLVAANPAQILKLPYGTLNVGAHADLVIVNLNKPALLKHDQLHGKARNTPFEDNHKFPSSIHSTIVNGAFVHQRSP